MAAQHLICSLQSFYELWGEGSSFEAMAAEIQSKSSHLIHKYGHESISWKIIVDSWGGRLSQAEQVAVIEKLAFLAFKVPALPLSSPWIGDIRPLQRKRVNCVIVY